MAGLANGWMSDYLLSLPLPLGAVLGLWLATVACSAFGIRDPFHSGIDASRIDLLRSSHLGMLGCFAGSLITWSAPRSAAIVGIVVCALGYWGQQKTFRLRQSRWEAARVRTLFNSLLLVTTLCGALIAGEPQAMSFVYVAGVFVRHLRGLQSLAREAQAATQGVFEKYLKLAAAAESAALIQASRTPNLRELHRVDDKRRKAG